MSPWNRSQAPRIAGLGLLSMLALALASPAWAGPETLKRSAGNILFAPLDIALAPVVSGQILYTNLRETEDSRWARIVYLLPGYVWVLGVELGASAIREVSGLLELLPGVGLLFFETEVDPLYPPVERGAALVDAQTDVLNVKFGVDYISQPID